MQANPPPDSAAMSTTANRPTAAQAWVLAARPKTLPAAVGPVLVGTAVAASDGGFALLPALAALLCALLLQVGSNFANDYFDFFKGADTADRMGPTRVTAAGLLAPPQVLMGMVVVFGMAALVGLYLVVVGGWPVLLLGVSAIAAAILYTGGPLPYGYYGLGELFVFLFFGLAAVVGTYYVQALTTTAQLWLAAVPVGALITAVLVVNNLRDRAGDERAGKRTLAVLLGERGARAEYIALLALAYAVALWLSVIRSPWLLLPLLSLPLAWPLVRSILHESGRALNKTLAGTARLSLVFSLLLALGFLLS
jgi:1,4-dihydroxy-2-naphthoate octaprenyltransferase